MTAIDPIPRFIVTNIRPQPGGLFAFRLESDPPDQRLARRHMAYLRRPGELFLIANYPYEWQPAIRDAFFAAYEAELTH